MFHCGIALEFTRVGYFLVSLPPSQIISSYFDFCSYQLLSCLQITLCIVKSSLHITIRWINWAIIMLVIFWLPCFFIINKKLLVINICFSLIPLREGVNWFFEFNKINSMQVKRNIYTHIKIIINIKILTIEFIFPLLQSAFDWCGSKPKHETNKISPRCPFLVNLLR